MINCTLRGVNTRLAMGLALALASCTESTPPKSQIDTRAVLPDGLLMTQSNGMTVTMSSPNLITPNDLQGSALQGNTPSTQATRRKFPSRSQRRKRAWRRRST